MSTTSVILDGFPLVGPTLGGGKAKLLGFEGWLSGTNDRVRGKRTAGTGSWSSKARRSERKITVVGTIIYSTPAAAAAERRELLALGGTGWTPLQVTDALGTLSMKVEVDEVEAAPVRDTMLRYTFELSAFDPFARAAGAVTVAVAAGATVEHTAAGTYPAEIEVTTTSSGTVDLTIGGLRLRTSSLPTGAVLTSGNGFARPRRTIRTALPENASIFDRIIQPMQWPAMVNGDNEIHQAGTAGLSIRYFPTYA